MNTYKEATVTPEKLTHMTHIEELPLFGKDALRLAVKTLHDVYAALRGDSTSSRITLKWDGSPSCVVASDFRGQSFVATKGFFSKEPKYATTQEEVQDLFGHAPELAEKMSMLLKYAPMLGVPRGQVWQGDFLFSKGDLEKQVIDGEACIIFHPNTIVYAIPSKDPLARRILNSEFGVVWHTRYTGDSIPDLKISFDVSVDELSNIPSIFQTDVNISTSSATLSPEESNAISSRMSSIEKMAPVVESSLNTLLSNGNLSLYLTTYRNAIIREGSESVDFDHLIEWVKDRYDKAIATKKQAKTQEAYARKRDEELAWMQAHAGEIKNLIAFEELIKDAKELFIKKLNTLGSFKTLINSLDKGYIPASQEGFAVSDQEGNITKLVSRLEFSRNNFSKEIVKGWMSDKRMNESVLDDKNEVSSLLDSLFQKYNLSPRGSLVKSGDTFKMIVEAPNGIPRKDAAQRLVDENRQDIVDAEIPSDKKRPVVTVRLGNFNVELHFKDNPGTTAGMDANATAEMEITWANFLYSYLVGKEFPSIEQAKETFIKVTPAWYETFVEGSRVLGNWLGNNRFVISREEYTIPKKSISIHQVINATFKKRKDVFGVVGRSKDAWNPSDIYACVENEYDSWVRGWVDMANDPSSTINDFNAYLAEGLENKKLVGISLKKLNNTPSIEIANMDKASSPLSKYTIDRFDITLGLLSNNPKGHAGFILDITDDEGNSYQGIARYFGSSDIASALGGAIQLEMTSRGKAARLGKVIKGVIPYSWASKFGVDISGKNESILLASHLENSSRLKRMVTEIEDSGIPTNITRDSYNQLLKELQNVTWDALSTKDKLYLAWLPQSIEFAYLYAKAYEEGSLQDILNDTINAAKKIGVYKAPFIKIT